MGTTPASARPSPTASKTARKPPTASVVDASPKYAWTASSANAPGSPENAASRVTPATERARPPGAAAAGPGDAAREAEPGSWAFITPSIRGGADGDRSGPAGRRRVAAGDRSGVGPYPKNAMIAAVSSEKAHRSTILPFRTWK